MGREAQNEISRERILKAALEEFGTKDYVSASTNSICKTHQISKGLLFHYYKSKDELFLMCVEKCFDELSDFLSREGSKAYQTVESSLEHYFKLRFEFFEREPYYAQIFHTAVFNPPEHLVEAIRERKQGLKQTNEVFLSNILSQMTLRDTIHQEEVIGMILGFGDYLQVKARMDGIALSTADILKEQSQTLSHMIHMLFYGIVK
ncbi:MAG: TetR/AcrR family transcriptional regulator [Cellulosilyticaceae bacterium]